MLNVKWNLVPAQTHHPQGIVGNLVRLIALKARSGAPENYNLSILVLRDVHRL